MKYTELKYRDYYHKYIVFEVDNLTDEVKDMVSVSQEDSFMLCYSYVDNAGELMFAVLSIGKSYDDCTKGLELEEELDIYSGMLMSIFDCKVIKPNMKMISKAYNISKKLENISNELKEILEEDSLDFVRNPYFPGNLLVQQNLNNFNIKITKIGDYIIDGVIEDGINDGIVRAVPYSSNGERRLITIVADKSVSEFEINMIEKFLIELSKGINKNSNISGMKS